jgi:serine/threonine protein kinase
MEEIKEKIINIDYDVDEEEFNSISKEAQDLLNSLLIKDKNSRLTAFEILSHPWMTDTKLEDIIVDLSPSKRIRFGSSKSTDFSSTSGKLSGIM